ncbi:MAG: AAA family ATPase [Magnetococcales bacterium]|nr:AAA family ATPase [Magnetococcales bacterium]
MRIVSFGCERYKAFRQRVEIELRPLTLILGKNNSGKSALLRLPRLLLRAISSRQNQRQFPLSVDGLSYGRVFRELIHGGYPHGSLKFSLVLDLSGGPVAVTAELQSSVGIGWHVLHHDLAPSWSVCA